MKIYSKTGKGTRALSTKSKELPSGALKVLPLIDSKTNTQEILAKLDRFSETDLRIVLAQLENGGYIREIVNQDWDLNPGTHDFQSTMIVEEINPDDFFGTDDHSTPTPPAAQTQDQARQAREAEQAAIKAEQEMAAAEAERMARQKAEREAAEKEQARKKAEEEAKREAQQSARELKERLAREAQQKAEAAARAKAEELRRNALLEAERKAAEKKRREEEEARARAEEAARIEAERLQDLARRKAEAEAKAEAERIARLEAERLEAERLAREAAEQKAREEEEARRQAEIKRQQEEARIQAEARAKAEEETRLAAEQARLEAERLAQEQARLQAEAEAKAEAERVARLEAERLEAERLAREAAEQKAREEEEARQQAEIKRQQEEARIQAEARAKAEEEARLAAEQARLEAERLAQEQARLQAEAEAKAEAERVARLEAERLEAERLAREAAEQKAREEEEARLAAEQVRLEAERLAQEQARLQAEAEEEARVRAAEAERIAQEEARLRAVADAQAATEAAARLEAERLAREAAERQAREREEARLHAETERKAFEEAERKAKEAEQTRLKAEAEEAKQQAKAEARQRAEEQARQKAERIQREKTEKLEKKRAAALAGRNAAPGALGKAIKKSFLALVITSLLLIIGLHFVNLAPIAEPVRKMASESIGEPVRFNSLKAALFPQPELLMGDVTIGETETIKLGAVHIVLSIATLLDESKSIDKLEMTDLTLHWHEVDRAHNWIASSAGTGNFKIERVGFKNLTLAVPGLTLPALNGRIDLLSDGQLGIIDISSVDQSVTVQLAPDDGHWRVMVDASNWQPPLNTHLKFDTLHAEGITHHQRTRFDKIEGRIYGGQITAKGNIDWSEAVRANGTFEAADIHLPSALIAAGQPESIKGTLKTSGTFASESANIYGLLENANVSAQFAIGEGLVSGVDLASAMLPANRDKNTRFSKLTGNLQLSNGLYRYRNLTLDSEQFRARGSLDIQEDQTISGAVQAELLIPSRRMQANFKLGGTARDVRMR